MKSTQTNLKTKSTLKTTLLGTAMALALIGFAYGVSHADELTPDATAAATTATTADGGNAGVWHHRHHRRGGFMLGVCVGETLAGQGITLPTPTPGQRPTLPATTQQAIHAAVQSCIAQFRGTQPSPTPSPTGSTAAGSDS